MFLIALLFACSTPPTPKPADTKPHASTPEPKVAAKPKHQGLFSALPADMFAGKKPSKEVIDLGRMLYYETRLSKNHDISCNSCHKLDGYGVDNEPTSPGHKGVRGGRNSPTTYNAALHVAQFWDGRALDVEAQAKGPILNPVEMAMKDEASVEAVLRSIPGYKKAFKAAFPESKKAITYDNMANAIGAFERGLVTRDRFDKYLGGDVKALTEAEIAGLDLFVSTGCASCHSGDVLGGKTYRKMGLVKPYETKDEGRKEVTKQDGDAFVFKVPSLRNIEKTGPYFHDGSATTLDDAVKKMAHHQLGKELSDSDTSKIVTFLGALTGEFPTEYVKKPALPKSGPKTPAADPK